MKLAILTQPLRDNYGGLLQAWALQKTLIELGHDCIIINREFIRPEDLPLLHRLIAKAKLAINILIGRQSRQVELSTEQIASVRANILQFLTNRYQRISPTIYTKSSLQEYVVEENFDGFIVGSDQVWRPLYSPSIGNYYLDFLPPDSKAKRIAYAASFGVDTWEYTSKQTKKCATLAHRFDLITVRESSGVNLVKEYLNATAVHVSDPTMLLSREAYENLINKPSVPIENSSGQLFCYVLDSSVGLSSAIQACAKAMNYKTYYCNALRKIESAEDLQHLEECVFPPVEQWLKSFHDAEMVITDSFHGTVFSIIFNRPFWVITNKARGESRFTSLLETFGLNNRIVRDLSKVNWNEPIDWNTVNKLRREFADKSREYLANILNK